MIKNYQFQNLTVYCEDNTNLQQTNRTMNEIANVFRFHLSGLAHRFQRGIIDKECFAVIRLTPDASFFIYVNPEMKRNPTFYRYDNITGILSDKINFNEFSRLEDLGVQAYLENRIDKIYKMNMERFVKNDTLQIARIMTGNYLESDYQELEYE